MKKVLFFAMSLLLTLSAGLVSCSSTDEATEEWDVNGLKSSRQASDSEGKIVIEYFERSGIKLRVVDITEQFTEARYFEAVPMKHVLVEELPTAIAPIVKQWGRAGLVKVFRMEYKGKTYYDLSSMYSSAIFNIYDSEGKANTIWNEGLTYDTLPDKVTDICCILVLDTEIVKSAENAPNYLIGTWENEWRPETSSLGVIHVDLPFNITEVLTFREDGTGYLRTIKQSMDHSEITLDPFRYELTDYHGGKEYGYDGYYYKCYFEAGDVIEYMARSHDNMRTLQNADRYWFKQSADLYESLPVNAGMKWGTPARDANSPIVGRWKGKSSSDISMTKAEWTWVFRSDNTGYRLLNGQLNAAFAYKASYNGIEAELLIWPNGETVKASIQGNTLNMEGWPTMQRED